MAVQIKDSSEVLLYEFPSEDIHSGTSIIHPGITGGMECFEEPLNFSANTEHKGFSNVGAITGDGKMLPKTIEISGYILGSSVDALRNELNLMGRRLTEIGENISYSRLYLSQNIISYPTYGSSGLLGWYYSLDKATVSNIDIIWLSKKGVDISVSITLADPKKYYTTLYPQALNWTVWPLDMTQWGTSTNYYYTDYSPVSDNSPPFIKLIPHQFHIVMLYGMVSDIRVINKTQFWADGNDHEFTYKGQLNVAGYYSNLTVYPDEGECSSAGDDTTKFLSGNFFDLYYGDNRIVIGAHRDTPGTAQRFMWAISYRPQTI